MADLTNEQKLIELLISCPPNHYICLHPSNAAQPLIDAYEVPLSEKGVPGSTEYYNAYWKASFDSIVLSSKNWPQLANRN